MRRAARARSAGAAHLTECARLRADARRQRGGAGLSRQARRRADRAVALHPAAGGGRGRDAMGRSARPRPAISRLGAQARRARPAPASRSSGPSQNPRATQGRPRCRSPRSRPGCAIPTRSTPATFCGLQPLDPVDTPPGARDRGTVIHGAIGTFTSRFKDALPTDPVAELIKLGEQEFAALEDFPEAKAFWWPRYPAHRALVRRFRSAAARERHRDQRGDLRQARHSARQPHLHAAHARRPHRASARRPLRHPRLQDRPGAHAVAGVVGTVAAAHTRRRDPARRAVRRNSGAGLDRGIPLRGAARRRACRRSSRPIAFKDATPDQKSDEALAKLTAVW